MQWGSCSGPHLTPANQADICPCRLCRTHLHHAPLFCLTIQIDSATLIFPPSQLPACCFGQFSSGFNTPLFFELRAVLSWPTSSYKCTLWNDHSSLHSFLTGFGHWRNNIGSDCAIARHKPKQNKNLKDNTSPRCALAHPSELCDLVKTWAIVKEVSSSTHMTGITWSCGHGVHLWVFSLCSISAK